MIIPPPDSNYGFTLLKDSPWKEIEIRMRRKTTIDSITGCWLFNGAKIGDGYGCIRTGKSTQLVHRIAAAIYLDYDLFNYSREYQVNHKDDICPYRNCWWHEHLYIGSQQNNISDILTKGKHISTIQSEKTHCPAGHPYDDENTYIDPTTGKRSCRTCKREKMRQYREARKGL